MQVFGGIVIVVTLRTCTRDKAIVCRRRCIGTKIARSRVLGICMCCKHNHLVDIGEKLVCMCFELLKKVLALQIVHFLFSMPVVIDHTHSTSIC